MKLEAPIKLIVNVRKGSGNNAARILGEGITASSTNSEAVAVGSAVDKLVARNCLTHLTRDMRNISPGQSLSTWMVILSPFK